MTRIGESSSDDGAELRSTAAGVSPTRERRIAARPPAWPARVADAAAGYAIAGGLVTLVGWVADVPWLTDWKGDGIAMFPNTAVAAVLSGVAILLQGVRRPTARRLARCLGATVALVGGLTLVEHLTGLGLGIDTLLLQRNWGERAAAAPMRMGPPAATSFFTIGVAVLVSTYGKRGRAIDAALGVTVGAIALLSLTGHLYGAAPMYTIPRVTGIAFQTATMVLALAIGLVARASDCEPMRSFVEQSAAGMLARRAFPIIVVLALALGWIRIAVQRAGLVDAPFGAALRTVLEIGLLTGLLAWAVRMIRAHEDALRDSEAEVRRQASQLAAFLDTAAIALHRTGPDGTILWANDAELEMLGWTRDEYVGRSIAEFHVDRQEADDMVARLRRGDTLLDHPARMRCKDGSIKSVLVDASVLRVDGRFVHTQCFTRDVTDRNRVEAEREEANRRKDEFIAILAHELRNPLAPVRTAARYLALKTVQGSGTERELARPVAIIERQVAQMSRLIDDLLDVSRMSRGVLALRPERVACADVVDAAIDACRDELQAKGHELRVEMPAEHVELEADRERLVQILCNLLGNAIRYTPAHGRIELAVVARDHTLDVIVRDDGIGIPPAKLEEIFDLFARVDHSLERQGGLGIGLTLVRQLVELHGGTIAARSAGVGHGSEFVLALPIVVSSAPATVPAPEPRPASAPLRILVADDNEDAVESLAMVLELGGHDVRTALDGEQAIAAFEQHEPDVALIDIGMPKANGYDVARAIRGHPSGKATYLVALTGWGQESDRARAQEAGFDAHLVKPVSSHALDELLAGVANEPATRERRPG